MRLHDIGKLSTRMFKTNPARTWLTIAGMGIGTGAVVTLVALGFGMQNIILEQIVFGETLLSLSVSAPLTRGVPLNDAALASFRSMPHVKDVAGMAQFPTLISMKGLTGNAFVQGVDPAYYRYTGASAVAGELHTDKNKNATSDGVVLTKALLKLFEIKEPKDAIGQIVTFRVLVPVDETGDMQEVPIERNYRVVGVSNDDAFISAFMQLTELRNYVQIAQYEKAQVRVVSSEFLPATTALVIAKGFMVTALSKTVDQANKIFSGIQVVLAVFGSIALAVSAIGMFNTMTVTLLERTKEIGIMRTLGASAQDIKILFLSESVIVGFLGGIMGIVFGLVIGGTLNGLVNLAAASFGGKSMSLFSFPIPFLVFIATFSALVGFMTGVFPAVRASKLSPLDAMRYG
ncbi:MAG TPA: ABC transporter permease [Candidatus Paceibacterota bacterium]|nr:ABC transporter permease [Candidatus Paceibacterota bacterium]